MKTHTTMKTPAPSSSEDAFEPSWSAPLPRRRSRWRVRRGLALALVAGIAFGAGRAARAPASPAFADDTPLAPRASARRELAPEAARARLAALVGARLLDLQPLDERALVVAYDVSDLLARPRTCDPIRFGGGGVGTFSFDEDLPELEPTELLARVEHELARDGAARPVLEGGVLTVRAGLAAQVRVARRLAWLDPRPASAAWLVPEVARARLRGLVGDRLLDVRADHARWLTVAYDVGDLLIEVEVPAPEVSLSLAFGPGGSGGAASGGVLTFDDEGDEPRGIDADKLVEVVEGKLGRDDLPFVECAGGVLVVRADLRTQEEVARLVAALERP